MANTSSKRGGEKGNTIVEMAITLIPFMALAVGLFDVSMLAFLEGTLSHAVAEGVRFAVTYRSSYNGTACSSQATCISQVAQDNAMGFLSGSHTSLVTVNYYTANDLTNPVMTCNSGSCSLLGTLPQTLSNGKVVDFPNQPGNLVEVRVANYPWYWIFPVSASGYSLTSPLTTLRASSVDVLGSLAPGTTTPPNP